MLHPTQYHRNGSVHEYVVVVTPRPILGCMSLIRCQHRASIITDCEAVIWTTVFTTPSFLLNRCADLVCPWCSIYGHMVQHQTGPQLHPCSSHVPATDIINSHWILSNPRIHHLTCCCHILPQARCAHTWPGTYKRAKASPEASPDKDLV